MKRTFTDGYDDLRDALRECVTACGELWDWAGGVDPCRYDHHGNCQEHSISNPCLVAEAGKALAKAKSVLDA